MAFLDKEGLAHFWSHIVAKLNEMVKREELSGVIDDTLAQAKESGQFDGADGYSPIRGTDYWTATDKAEIKSYVDEAILNGEW